LTGEVSAVNKVKRRD